MNNDIKIEILLALPFMLILILTGLNFNLAWDERDHMKGIDQFKDSFPEFDLKMYHAPTTPLYFIIFSLFAKTFGNEYWKLRLLNLIIGYLTIVIFFRISKDLKNQYPFLNTLFFLFFPYYLVLSSLVMTDILALFFGLLAIRFYLNDDSTKNMLMGSMFSILAIYTRQFWLFLPAGMLLYSIIRYKMDILKELKKIFILFIPIIAILPLILYWKGLSPPAWQEGRFYITNNFNQITSFLLLVGFYFIPFLIVVKHKFNKKFVFIYLILIAIYPISISYINECNGIICQVLTFNSYLYPFLLFILLFIGLTIILTYLSNNEYNLKLISLILSYLGIILLTPWISERYLMVLVPLLILALFNKIERRIWVYYLWIIIMILNSMVYYIHKIIQ
ncbi:hypothetical protein METP3_00118 [Methanosarcinales archaeon]|nr:hypothetical protein METP3_00118 [Methanosarcinales archaeon]